MSAKLRMIVQHGLSTLRAGEKNGLQPALAIHWAQCLSQTVHNHPHIQTCTVTTSSVSGQLDKRKEVFSVLGSRPPVGLLAKQILLHEISYSDVVFVLYFYNIPNSDSLKTLHTK